CATFAGIRRLITARNWPPWRIRRPGEGVANAAKVLEYQPPLAGTAPKETRHVVADRLHRAGDGRRFHRLFRRARDRTNLPGGEPAGVSCHVFSAPLVCLADCGSNHAAAGAAPISWLPARPGMCLRAW